MCFIGIRRLVLEEVHNDILAVACEIHAQCMYTVPRMNIQQHHGNEKK